jgi:predicted RNA-binding protein with TRAM domain
MSYKSDQLTLVSQPIAGPRQWVYQDTGSGVAAVVASGFFTDGADKGMKVGDQLTYLDKTATINYGMRVSAVSDTGATQATIDGQVIVGDTS